MFCPCGYSFIPNDGSLEREHKSYILVNYENYNELLKRELDIVKKRELNIINSPPTEEMYIDAIASAAELTGWLEVCPKCDRVFLYFPDMKGSFFYTKENGSIYPMKGQL